MAEETLLKRVAPNSLEAEQSVVGAMLMDKEAIEIASEIVNPDDFYNRQLGTVFETMVELNREGSAVDFVTLQNRLRRTCFRSADICKCKVLCSDSCR